MHYNETKFRYTEFHSLLAKNMEKLKKELKELEKMRHSCEHVLTMAMLRLWGKKIKAAMGPATEEGFYFDFDSVGIRISETDFPKIEAEMAKIIKEDLPILKDEMTIKEAKKFFNTNIYKDNEYKHEWLDLIQSRKEKVSIYWMGKKNKDMPETFVDICSGPHVKSTGKISSFKLLSIAGAYWHGSEKNKMLTRIYGTCFATQKELDQWIWLQEESKKRDHRILGQQLGLFIFDDEVGQGLPLWMPNGAWLKYIIQNFALDTYLKNGYQPVSTPHIASSKLWGHSGHLDFYKDSMYSAFGIEGEDYLLKPMNCPFHLRMYLSQKRSYRELPLRWTEMGTVYRYEKSGTLHGLMRVRGFTQDDAHIICTPEQLAEEAYQALKLTLYMLKTFGFKDFEMNLSVRDPKNKKKFIGSDQQWQMAEKVLKSVLKRANYSNFIYDIGGAVFYGPKIDIKVADTIGRKWQLSTIQFDFNLPKRFGMTYIGSDGKEHAPYMIHRALLGSLERFIGVLIEHYAGAFPVWLSPVQARVIPITDRHSEYANLVKDELAKQNIRVEVDLKQETTSAKIRNGELQKIPYLLIVGDRELEAKTVSIRQRKKGNIGVMKLNDFIVKIKQEIEQKTI